MSTLHTGAVDPPVEIVQGAGGSNNRYVKQLTISENGTSFTAELRVRAGADVLLRDVVRIANPGGAGQAITLTGTQVNSIWTERFEWRVMDGGTQVALLDHRAASPSVSFTLPAGTDHELDLRVDTADGAGLVNARVTFEVAMEVDG